MPSQTITVAVAGTDYIATNPGGRGRGNTWTVAELDLTVQVEQLSWTRPGKPQIWDLPSGTVRVGNPAGRPVYALTRSDLPGGRRAYTADYIAPDDSRRRVITESADEVVWNEIHVDWRRLVLAAAIAAKLAGAPAVAVTDTAPVAGTAAVADTASATPVKVLNGFADALVDPLPVAEFFGLKTTDAGYPMIANLLETALVHESYLHENRDLLPDVTPGVLRGLETLGSVWLGRDLAIRLFMGRHFDGVGQLSTLHAATMTAFGEWLQSVDWLMSSVRYGKGESQSAPSKQTRRRLANQVIGAMVLAQAESRLRAALQPFFESALALVPPVPASDAQAFVATQVRQESLDWKYIRSGPDHDARFVAILTTKDKRTSRGKGKSKKLAREAAAQAFIERYLEKAGAKSPRAKSQSHGFTLPSDVRAPATTRKAIEQIRHEFGLQHRWQPLLFQALVHSSWAYEHQSEIKAAKQKDNSLLAFVGSWVVNYEHAHSMARMALDTRAAELSLLTLTEEQLAKVSGRLGLEDAMLLGRGEERSRGQRISLSSNALQATVAAVFLALKTPPLLTDKLPPRWSDLRATLTSGRLPTSDYKTTLQEFAAAAEFDVAYKWESKGPDHARSFYAHVELVSAALNKRISVRGPWASSRKAAEQRSAEPIVEVILALGAPLIDGPPPKVRGTVFMMTHLLAVAQARPTVGQRWSKRGLLGAEIAQPHELLKWARAADAFVEKHHITSVDAAKLADFYRHSAVQRSPLRIAAKKLTEVAKVLIELENPSAITSALEADLVCLSAVCRVAGDQSRPSSLNEAVSAWRSLYARRLTVAGDPPAAELSASERGILDYLVGRLVEVHGALTISIARNSLRIKPNTGPIDGSVVSAVALSGDLTARADISVDGDSLAVDLVGVAPESDGPITYAVISALCPEPSSLNSSTANTLHDITNQIAASRQAAASAQELSRTQRLSRESIARQHLDEAKVLARQLQAVDQESPATQRVEGSDIATSDTVASETIDPEAMLASLSDIRVEMHNGRAVPYQFVVLLWAISQARFGAPRLAHYRDVKGQLAQLLSPFKVSDSPPNPANPWFALHSSDWWEMSPPLPADYKQVNSLNTPAGLRKPIYDMIATDAQLTKRAVEKIIGVLGDSSDAQDLLVTLNLADVSMIAPPNDILPERIPMEKHPGLGAARVSGGRAAKRRQLADSWAAYYPQPLAELIAVVTQPFDDDDTALAGATVEAHKGARREVRQLFPPGEGRPSGGQIEAPLCEIACRLFEVLRADEAASLSAERLSSAIALLGDVVPVRSVVLADDLVVPEVARRLDSEVPFAMWR
jgi:dsRNA-specific ribonuclease